MSRCRALLRAALAVVVTFPALIAHASEARRSGEILVQLSTPAPDLWAAHRGALTMLTAQVALFQFDETAVDFATTVRRLHNFKGVGRIEANLRAWPADDWAHRDLRAAQNFEAALAPPLFRAPARAPVRVGLVDSGIDARHPDLQGRVAPGVNLLYRPDGSTAEVQDRTEMDYHGHGTAMAGIIGANHNDFGVDGIDDAATLVGIKVFDADGVGYLSDVLRAVQWALTHDIDILNMSFGFYEPSDLFEEALAQARKRMLLVAAAGNDGVGTVNYPAAYPGVIAVGGLAQERISRSSNFGPRVDFYAPATDLLSTATSKLSPNVYAPTGGTSAATAYVTGVLSALLTAGYSPADALRTLHRQSVWHHHGAAAFRSIDAPRVLAQARGVNLKRLQVTDFHVPAFASPQAPLPVAVTLQNTGTEASAAIPLRLALRVFERDLTLELGVLPALAPEAVHTATYAVSLPQAWLGDAARTPMAVRLVADAWHSTPLDVVLTDVPEAQAHIDHVWLVPQVRTDKPQVLHVQLTNAGNAPLSAHNVQGFAMGAVHEGLFKVPQLPITQITEVGPLAPGAGVELQMPISEEILASSELTLMAEVTDTTGQAVARGYQSFHVSPQGQAHLLYTQTAHMASVESAVELLALENVLIADLHAPDSPFKGSAVTSRDYGTAVAVGTSRWRWDWQRDWSQYPQTARHLVDGASAADGIDVAFGNTGMATWDTHYWMVDEGDDVGLNGHSVLTKVYALLLGGYGSTIKDGAIAAYKAGEKARAWWMVGHAAHLIGDVSTGAHSINRNWHGVVGDPYHDWLSHDGHQQAWPASVVLLGGGLQDPYRSELPSVQERLRFLTYTTAQIGSAFPWHRTRGWLPNGGNDYGDGNRVWGGDAPHYDDYLHAYLDKFADHPHSIRDLNRYEVTDARGACQAARGVGGRNTPADCWDHGDGHIDVSNLGVSDGDGDLSRVADAAYTHAVRSIAGLLYLFAVETGQMSPRLR